MKGKKDQAVVYGKAEFMWQVGKTAERVVTAWLKYLYNFTRGAYCCRIRLYEIKI